jgi:hypothetical protein
MAVNSYFPQNCAVYMGLHADTKPAAGIGSKFIETDTGAVFMMYNTGAWTQVASIPISAWTEPAVTL